MRDKISYLKISVKIVQSEAILSLKFGKNCDNLNVETRASRVRLRSKVVVVRRYRTVDCS